ncbi:MAG TPA: DUF167 domain-containing protein [Burkholderiales bacterium]|nr:DUF167 domain-containing protein [Burkholderiales bacterium]
MAAEASWARRTAVGWILAVHVQPGAKRSEVAGPHGDRLKVRIAAPALDSRANEALVAFVAEALGVPKRSVSVAAGERSRDKIVAVGAHCDPTRLLDDGDR